MKNATSLPEIYTRAEIGAIRPELREIDVVASTESLDSHGTVLRQNWRLDRFKANPVVLFGHDRTAIPIGKAPKVKIEGPKGSKRLLATIRFREEGKSTQADEVWSAVEDETLRGISVGFRSHSQRVEKADDREFLVLDDNELFEISIVPVPSNSETLAAMRSRMLGADTPQPDQGSHNQEASDMDPKLIARALGLPEDTAQNVLEARFAVIVDERSKLLFALGKDNLDDALRAIEDGKREAVDAAQREREGILTNLRDERKVTPAMEKDFVSKLSIEDLRSFAKVASPVALITPSGHRQPSRSDSPSSDLRYENLSNIERAELKKSDPETFEAVRSDWISRGQPTHQAAAK